MSQHGLSPLGKSGLFRCRTAGVAVATAAATVASLGAVPAATSAPDPSCPAAYPVERLADGQSVHGLTVSKGTTPESFGGEVLGVLEDGIAPDLDMIIVRLTSSEIDRVGGIWSGMSGSPVYAADGRLIGAVSYGLAWGSSPVAGVTPAADMQELLTAAPADSQARSTLRTADEKDKVAIPRSMQREMVSSGTAERSEVDSGMSRLPIPLGISGMINSKRLKYAARTLDMDDVRVYKAGAVTANSAPSEMVAGGNLAASLSYGDVSSVGVGTATAVCGDEVLAFGHPMSFSGPSTLTMHGANAIYIQEESLGAPFKVANATAPVGAIVQDRLAGLLGREGSIPATTRVTSHVAVTGEKFRDGETNISVPNAVPDIAAFHLLANQDRVFDGITGGSSAVSWTVTGERADGSLFSYTRNDRYADQYDVSFAPVFDLFDQLWQLQNNGVEDVTITDVHERSVMSRDFKAFTVKKVEVRSGGEWNRLRTDRALQVRAGTTKRFRATLTSAQFATRTVRLDVPVPQRAARKFGYLEILGGNSFFSEGGGEEGSMSSSTETLDQLLRRLARAPRNDDLLANLYLFRNDGSTLRRSARKQVPAVVDGGISVEVRGLAR